MDKLNRNIESYVKYYDFLTQEECQNTVKEISTINWSTHAFYSPTDNTYQSFENELSVSHDDFPMKKHIFDKIWFALQRYMADLNSENECLSSWYGGWNGYTVPRFNKYSKGTEMKIHCDHIHSMFDGSRKGVPVLTVLGALNDDYEGGELVMWNDTQIELTAGKIMIFPSNFLYPHEVKIVKEGIRYSFVSWVW